MKIILEVSNSSIDKAYDEEIIDGKSFIMIAAIIASALESKGLEVTFPIQE